MLEVIMFFRRLFGLPYDLVTGTTRFFRTNWNTSVKQRALMLGLPAVVVAGLAMVLLGVSQGITKSRLEPWYLNEKEKNDRDIASLSAELTKIRKLGAVVPGEGEEPEDSENEGMTLEEEDAKLVKEGEELIKKKQILLEKLVDLAPKDSKYRFELAQTYRGRNNDKYQAIIRKLAPDDKAVFYKAHAAMARQYFALAQQSKARNQKMAYFEKARVQAEHCLTQQPEDQFAREIKARVLQDSGQFTAAYNVYEELFDIEPAYYLAMVQVNEARGTPENNDSVLERAYTKFKARLKQNENDDIAIWVNSWDNIVRCLLIKKDYELAIKELQAELDRERKEPRQVYLRERIGDVYSTWAVTSDYQGTEDLAQRKIILERLREAIKRNPKSAQTQLQLSYIVNHDPELSEEARKIYDPSKDPSAPPGVLSHLGAKALQENDYKNAIYYFEQANAANPNDPVLLNNLAYAYLVSEEKETADRALYLINDAIKRLQENPNGDKYLSELHHTRGTALMRLSRMEEAAASFEISLSYRPDHISTLESLIQCYEGRLESEADFCRAYLDELKASESEN